DSSLFAPERVFRRLPQPLKTLAASVHGARLARRRFGGTGPVAETERLVDEALEREQWDASRWRRYLDERTSEMLRHAATRVPYYRSLWAAGDAEPSRDLAHWPVLEKDAVRQAPEAFIADGSPRLYPEATSGTTGTPLRLFRSAEVERQWYALFEARSRRWYGVDRFAPWAILGGRLVVPPERAEPPFWVWNAGLRQLYLSSYHLHPRHARSFLDAMARRDVRHVYGSSSAIHELARAVLEVDPEVGRRLGLAVAVTNAEPLLPVQRRDIEAAFGCPARETWGMAELVAAAGECEHGRMHLWPEVGLVEVDVVEVNKGREVIATTLIARDQPLIRYRLGDRLAEAPAPPGEASCPCGRTLPVITGLEGRVDDALVLPDGRRVGRLDPVFKGDLPIREAQIVQESPAQVRLRYVPADGFDDASSAELRRRLADRLGGPGTDQGQVEIVLDAVERIPRDANGKFRAVVRAFDLDAVDLDAVDLDEDPP
ncbi:MAG TPA: hypothetical protein VLA56_21705, partial [Pseudomonadales bacterium]|nr:hypothetical protein [Pseudomonadales bacterium]